VGPPGASRPGCAGAGKNHHQRSTGGAGIIAYTLLRSTWNPDKRPL
jgi:hypothetical protein